MRGKIRYRPEEYTAGVANKAAARLHTDWVRFGMKDHDVDGPPGFACGIRLCRLFLKVNSPTLGIFPPAVPGKFVLQPVLLPQKHDVGGKEEGGESKEPDADGGGHIDLWISSRGVPPPGEVLSDNPRANSCRL